MLKVIKSNSVGQQFSQVLGPTHELCIIMQYIHNDQWSFYLIFNKNYSKFFFLSIKYF